MSVQFRPKNIPFLSSWLNCTPIQSTQTDFLNDNSICRPEPFLSTLRKVFFFVRLQTFLHAGCNFLPPEEFTQHAKNYECGYWCLQIWSRNSSKLAFLGNFCTNIKFQSKLHNIQFCSMEKNICSLHKKKLYPDENFLQYAKL